MGEHTKISWTDATQNFWIGCHKVSPGCKFCYAEQGMTRFGKDFSTVTCAKPATFSAPLRWLEPKKIFVCSWSDFFVAEADPWRDTAWGIMRQAPWHTYQILTKRPERILDHLPADWGAGWPNVWIGVSAENQAMADLRLPILREVPAVVRFVSAEPLLEPIQLDLTGISWLIVGAESGPKRRPFDKAWATDLHGQCRAANVAFWFKQGSGLLPGQDDLLGGRHIHEFPEAQASTHNLLS